MNKLRYVGGNYVVREEVGTISWQKNCCNYTLLNFVERET